MLWLIDTCQNELSADQYHMSMSWAQFKAYQGQIFLKLTADQVLVFNWIAGSSQVNLLYEEITRELCL